MSSSPSHHPCPTIRPRLLAALPLAIVLLLFQTFHRELLSAEHIANQEWALPEFAPLALPLDGTASPLTPLDPEAPLVINHQHNPSNSFVSEERQAEIMARAEEEQFHFTQTSGSTGAFQAANPTQRLSFHHSRSGLTITPRPPAPNPLTPSNPESPAWHIHLQSTTLTLDAHSTPLDQSTATPSSFENQSSLDLAPGCNEWFINRSAGLEHGYTIQEPTAQAPQSLSIRIAVSSTLSTRFDPATQTVQFLNEVGRSLVIYHALHVYDRTGHELPSALALTTTNTAGTTITLTCDIRGALFPLTIDPVVATQIGTGRTASDGGSGDEYGTATAGLGDYAAIGSPGKDNGKVYLQHRHKGGEDHFGEQSSLTLPASESPGTADRFGAALAFGEDEATGTQYLAVGAPAHRGRGSVFLYSLDGNSWVYLKKFSPNALTGGDQFGFSLAMSGPMLAVGAPTHLGPGSVFIFTPQSHPTDPFQTIRPTGGVSGDEFGFDVDLVDTLLAIGAPGETSRDGNSLVEAGAAYAYRAPARLEPFSQSAIRFDATPNSGANDRMGSAVAVNQDRIAIGIPGADEVLFNGGASGPEPERKLDVGRVVIFFLLATGGWGNHASIFGRVAFAFLGAALSMNVFGDLAIGAPGGLLIAGLIYLFLFNPITRKYSRSGDKINPSPAATPSMLFAASVLLLGTLLFAMAPNFNSAQGIFYLFALAATALPFTAWMLLFFDANLVNNPDLQHLFGWLGDSDGDGIPNNLEYATNLLPTVFDANPLKITRGLNGDLRLLLPFSLIALEAFLLLLYSLNLVTWFGLGEGPLRDFFSSRTIYAGITTQFLVLTITLAGLLFSNAHFRPNVTEKDS